VSSASLYAQSNKPKIVIEKMLESFTVKLLVTGIQIL